LKVSPDDQLHTSMQLQMACAMCLIIIGEAAVRIEQKSPDFVVSTSVIGHGTRCAG